MSKYTITQELASLIKTMRMQRKITSKRLAEYIKKSPSYVSKLESNEIKMIQEEELTTILEYIVEGENFYSDKLPAIIRMLSNFQAPEKMSQQIWLLNYDIAKRPITLPDSMIDDINRRLHALDINIDQFAEWINANRDSAMTSAFPANEVVDFVFRDTHILLLRMAVKKDELSALLEKRTLESNYAFIHGLVFTLLRIEEYDGADLNGDDARKLLHNTRTFLDHYGVYSLTEWNRLVFSSGNFESHQDLLSAFSAANAEIINQLIEFFRIATEHDMLHAAQALEAFRENLSWDQGFMLKLIGQPFYQLNDMSFNLKRQLVEDIISLLEKYKRVPATKKSFETYWS